jgi:DNA-binding transcriptional MerR regulator
MFKIRDFSQLTRVSVKMLRHYDEIGLLKPAFVDPATSYRYYAADQLPRLNQIIALKDLGFTLEQIARSLDAPFAADQLRELLVSRRAELEQELRLARARLAQVEARLRAIDAGDRPAPYEVVARPVAPLLAATIRRRVPTLGAPIAQLFDGVEAHVARHRARAASSPLTIFHDQEYREEQLDVEVAVPISAPIPPGAGVTPRRIEGGAMACVVYTGGYERMGDVLQALLRWVDANNHRVAGPLREVYLRFGADNAADLRLPPAFLADHPAHFVTEVQLPIEAAERVQLAGDRPPVTPRPV